MKDILKDVTRDQSSSHGFGQVVQSLIVLNYGLHPIVLPKVLKVTFDLLVQRFGKRLISGEPHHERHPVPQWCHPINTAHLPLVVL